MNIEIKPHPDKRIDTVKSIYYNGLHIGFCGAVAGKPVTINYHVSEAERAKIEAIVTETCGAPNKITGGGAERPDIPKEYRIRKPQPEPVQQELPETNEGE